MSSVIRFNINNSLKDPASILNDRKLILLVKKENSIWDFHNKDYKNIKSRNAKWASIGATLKQDPVNCQKRWKVIRERYCIHFRRFQKTNLKPKWDSFDELEFLNPFVNFKDKSMTSEMDSENDKDENLQEINKKIDLEKLINLVKERRNLYDKSHESFRNSSVRKKTWDEIGKIMNCKGSHCQTKWRTQRDRFVRELRRSKNAESDFHCTKLFKNMLFLTKHIRAKTYWAEVENMESPEPDYSYCDNENTEDFDHRQDFQETEYSSNVCKTEYAEESNFDEAEVADDTHDLNDEYEDATEYMEMGNMEDDEPEEIEEYEETADPIKSECIFSEEILNSNQGENEELLIAIKPEPTQKEIIVINDDNDEISPPPKRQKNETTTKSLNSDANHAFAITDEDTAFGNMLGFMLKKIPDNLKIQVKLKLMQSLADFEKEHNLC